jgi:hypothetical protein
MMGAGMAPETLAYSPWGYLTRFIAREHFIQYSRCESFKLYISVLLLVQLQFHIPLIYNIEL